MSLGGIIADLQRRGISPRQHHDPEWPIPDRIVTYSARVVRNPKRDPLDLAGADILDPQLEVGDDLGWHLWAAASPAKRECSAWFSGATPAGILGGDVVPLRGPGQLDDRFAGRAQSAPSWATQFPGQWTGLAGTGTEEFAQLETWHPDFLGLVAPNAGGKGRFGTKVFDLKANSDIDPSRWAHLQSLVSVVKLGGGGCGGVGGDALALQLGKSGQDQLSGGGLYVEWFPAAKGAVTTTGVSKPKKLRKVIGVTSHREGSGPFLTGGENDVHRLGTDADGHPVNAIHISTDALFKGNEGDGPLFFGGAWVEPEPDGPFLQRTYLRWNPGFPHNFCGGQRPGMWEWETPTWFYVPDPEPEGDRFPPRQPPPQEPIGVIGGFLPGGLADAFGNVPGVSLIGDTPPVRPNYAQAANCVIFAGGVVNKAAAWARGAADFTGAAAVTSYGRKLIDAAPATSKTQGFAPGHEGNGSWFDWIFEDQGAGPSPTPLPGASGAGDVYLPVDRLVEDAINGEDYGGNGVTLYMPTKTSRLGFGDPNPTGGWTDCVTLKAKDDGSDIQVDYYNSSGTPTSKNLLDAFDSGGNHPADEPGQATVTTPAGTDLQWGQTYYEELLTAPGSGTTIDISTAIPNGSTIIDVLTLVEVTFTNGGAGDQYSVGNQSSSSRWCSASGGYTTGTATGRGQYGSDPRQFIASSVAGTIRITAAGFTFSGDTTGQIRVVVIYETATDLS